jgi:hypothetical protein
MSARLVILASLAITVTGCEQQPVTANRPQYLAAAERAPYIKDFQPSCLVTLRTGALSRYLSEEQHAEYCSCAAVRSAETITLDEIRTWNRMRDRELLKPHMAAVDNYCLEKLIPLWLLTIVRPAAG